MAGVSKNYPADYDGDQQCKVCDEYKHISNFKTEKNRHGNVKYRTTCIQCRAMQVQSRTYGVEFETLGIMLKMGCSVCGSHKRLSCDHDHATGLFRGILCSKCNSALGLLDEDTERILQLHAYISDK